MMGQRQREQVQRGCAVGTVVLLAWLCRVLPLEGMPSGLQEACGILRSLLYLSLFAGWGISLYNRTVHPQVRRLLLNVDLLMLFWILVRTLRFQLNTPPEMDRMLGYLYYAPMLGIPVLCVQLVLTVDRSERYRLSAWARMLWLPSAVLLELVLTNDLHQQVFRLQQPGAGRGGVRHGGDPRGPASGGGGSGLLQPVRVGGGGGAGAAGCPVCAGHLEGPPAEPLSFGGDRGGPESRLPRRCAGGPGQLGAERSL